jgi:hypothetical protein
MPYPFHALQTPSTPERAGLARRLAPEDVLPGQYVCVLARHEVYHRFDCTQDRFVGHRVRDLPAMDSEGDDHAGGRAGQPLRVLAVCLPFAVVQMVGPPRPADEGEAVQAPARSLDLRQVELARVDAGYARAFAEARGCAPPE